MDSLSNLTPIQESLAKAKNILVLLPINPNLDQVAAGLGLFLALKKQGKTVLTACPSAMTVGFNHLVGVNKISNSIGNRNLIISFDYLKDAIEKVSYNIESDKFNLVVEPRVGYPALQADKVSYSYSGAQADLIFVIGANRLEDLDKLYFNEKKTFETAQVINIDYKLTNTKFGKVNLIDHQTSSCSEIVINFLRRLNFAFDQDMATNLLTGIISATNNFQSPSTTPVAFEAVAFCLSNGAKREFLSPGQGTQPMVAPGVPPLQQTRNSFPLPFAPMTAGMPAPANQPQAIPANSSYSKPVQPPPDWLKPKIYKGGSFF